MRLDRATLVRLFEGAPAFVEQLLTETPSASGDEFFRRAERTALALPPIEQVALLDSHPRIGAAPSSVSALSYAEQGYDRDAGSAELQARLDRLNDEYERRFGFRFVIFVAGRSRSEIADLMADHLAESVDEERERGLRDVIAIARDRAARLQIEMEAAQG